MKKLERQIAHYSRLVARLLSSRMTFVRRGSEAPGQRPLGDTALPPARTRHWLNVDLGAFEAQADVVVLIIQESPSDLAAFERKRSRA